ncbi:dioxygenase family protein [Paractinoplanes durhamensis]|uniref:dioxygenase family protein n=1 Tax=Paractinoplanes durhamensis TaxID=113563 RepID=UPI00362C441A
MAAVAAGRTFAPLVRSGIVRSDIRRSFGTASGVARGVPLDIRLRLTSANSGRPLTGYAVYLWHCDQNGNYSLYGEGLERANYLRGVQTADTAGWARFTSIFPGAHDGRWPRLHVEIYSGPACRDLLHRAQIALPGDAAEQVYATGGYAATLDAGTMSMPLEMACVTGDVRRGMVATKTLAI